MIFGGEGSEVDQHIGEEFDIKTNTINFIETHDLIKYKSMNFWTSVFYNITNNFYI